MAGGCGEAFQRAAVDLAGGAQRQCGQDGERGREHVGGQAAGEVGAHRVQGAGGDGEGGQAPVGALAGGDDGGLLDARHRTQRRLDLAQLDAVAADLDLGVAAAEEL